MLNRPKLRAQAKELRLTGNFKDALQLYEQLWEETKAEIDAAGIIHCLRKQKEFGKVFSFTEQLYFEPYKMDWLNNELAWTYIEGRLLKYKDDASIATIIETAKKITRMKPDPIAVKTTIFIVLKAAKQHGRWDIVDEWIDKIDPDSLSSDPTNSHGKVGWSDQSSWYNFRIRCFIELNQSNKALELVQQIEDRYPRERKFFLRLKGLANYKIGLLPEALEVYKHLCAVPNPDWWLLHENANVIYRIAQKENDIPMKEVALNLLFKSANIVAKTNKLESMLKLLRDITEISQELRHWETAFLHILLYKQIREDNKWPIPPYVNEIIQRLHECTGKDYLSKIKLELLTDCHGLWKTSVAQDTARHSSIEVVGKVIMGRADRPYCFIVSAEKNCFCAKTKLPSEIKDGDIVRAEIVSAYDSKKNQDGWKTLKVWKK